jgi:nucleoside phosphorylase
MSPMLGPSLTHNFKHSPEALTPARTRRRLSPVPLLEGIPPPIMDQVSAVVGVLGKPVDNSSYSGNGENGPRAFSNALMNELTMAQKSQGSNRGPNFSHRISHGTGLSASRQDTGFSSGTGRSVSSPSVQDYNVGWICAIETEYVVAQELLDEEFTRPSGLSTRDKNAYAFGRIGNHYVVIGCLPMGRYGLTSATSAAKDMLRSFENIDIGLMVGIGGGAPSKKHDIRLGDVVVSIPGHQSGGVVHYDFGKAIQNHEFERTGSLASPSKFLLGSLQDLKTSHSRYRHRIPETISAMLKKNEYLRKKYQKPDHSHDILYKSSFIHKYDDRKCSDICIQNTEEIVPRLERDPDEYDPVVHYGLIASADRLMKDAVLRDQLAKKEDVLCFEMEAAGLMDEFECVVIRGICDYSDTHKNDIWQGYAAATAAAYAKELLGVIPRNMGTQERASPVEGSPELHAEPWT